MSRHKLVAKLMQNQTNLLHDEIYNKSANGTKSQMSSKKQQSNSLKVKPREPRAKLQLAVKKIQEKRNITAKQCFYSLNIIFNAMLFTFPSTLTGILVQ